MAAESKTIKKYIISLVIYNLFKISKLGHIKLKAFFVFI